MPRTSDDSTLFVTTATAEFRSANPDVFGKAQGDLDTTRRLGAIELRAEAIKQRFYAHFDRHHDAWVADEASKLIGRRSFPTFQPAAPHGFVTPPRGPDIAELMANKAMQNVHARAIRRLTVINSVKANLQNALVRNRPKLSQAQMPAGNDQHQHGPKQGNS